MYVCELTGRVENYLLLSGLEGAARSNDVTSAQHASKSPWLQPVRSQPVLRVFKIDRLRQYPSPFHLGRFRRTLNRATDQVRKDVKIGIAVFVARDLGQLPASFLAIANDDWIPGAGMQIRSLQVRLTESLASVTDPCVSCGRDTIYSDKSASLN